MNKLPSPRELLQFLSVPGVFIAESYQRQDCGIEVFGRVISGEHVFPIGLAAYAFCGHGCRDDAPFVETWPIRRSSKENTGFVAVSDSLEKTIHSRLAGADWFESGFSGMKPPVRVWSLSHGSPGEDITSEMLASVGSGEDLSFHLNLYSNCVQKCAFCPVQNPIWSSVDQDRDLDLVCRLAERIVRPARAHGQMSTFALNADDLLGHRHLGAILQVIADASGCPIHLLIPPGRLASASVADAVAGLPGLQKISTSVFGASAEVHDAVAGTPGAFVRMVRALRNISRLPLQVNGQFILTRRAVPELSPVLDMLLHFDFEVTIRSLISDCARHDEILGDVTPEIGDVRSALEAAGSRLEQAAAGAGLSIADFPVCAVPSALRSHARADLRRANLYGHELVPACSGCRHSDSCIGLSRSYRVRYGESGVRPEP
ncbi:MAG TPA: hypothetical protein PLY68_00460 [Myxococcota bacterium]|nr:hypothetical protein [Myxococcota bacterium]HQP94649.1 hypothetical protein [Myxococcota bacterium]